MASNSDGYWSRSYALLTRDQGWIKPILVLAAAQMIPVVGSFGADGYALEWARLTSWGVDSSPKQKNVDIGACIGSGARAFVVALGYGIVLGLLSYAVRAILGEGLGAIISYVLMTAASVIVIIAKLRAVIYQTIGAGYQVNRVVDMVKRDSNGVLRIVGLKLILNVVVGVTATILIFAVLAANFAGIVGELIQYETTGYIDEYHVATLMFSALASSLPALMVVMYLVLVGTTFGNLIATTAVGLWMRQFDVQNWGQSSDPLPGSAPSPTETEPVYPTYPVSDQVNPAPEPEVSPVATDNAYDYQPAPLAIPTPVEAEPTAAETFTLEPEAPTQVRTFSLDDAASDEPIEPQPVDMPQQAGSPIEQAEPAIEGEIPAEAEAEAEYMAFEPKIEPNSDPEAELETTPENLLEQAEAAIKAADLTAPIEPDVAEAPATFDLDDAAASLDVVEEADDPAWTTSDDVITKVIPLSGEEEATE